MDSGQTLHEPSLRQIELERQNHDLRRALEASRARYFDLYDLAPIGYLTFSEDGLILEANFAATDLLGVARNALVRQPLSHFIVRDDQDTYQLNQRRLFETGVRQAFEMRMLRRGAGPIWVRFEASAAPEGEDGALVARAALSDISARKQAENALQTAHAELESRVHERTAELSRLNETLRMISECDQALVRSATEQELVGEICRIIKERGGYRMAWVGYAESDDTKRVRPVAAVGAIASDFEEARITWADEERGRGPTGSCIRLREVRVARDFFEDPELAPWRELARARGIRSALAFPLTADGRTFGALTIYAAEPAAFDPDRARLLAGLIDDLAFGIVALRARADLQEARRAAEVKARQLSALATQLGETEQRERQRLARLLHDHVQQLLVGANYSLAAIGRHLTRKADHDALRNVTTILDEAIESVGSLTADLSPTVLLEKGLAAGLTWLGGQFSEKYGLQVDVRCAAGSEPASEQVRLFLYEAVRELLFNVVKHAFVQRAAVSLSRLGNHEVQITVADEGAGFDPDSGAAVRPGTGSFGLFSVRERLTYLGGRLSIDSAPGRGSRFTLVAPVSEPAQAASQAAAAPAEREATGAAAFLTKSRPQADVIAAMRSYRETETRAGRVKRGAAQGGGAGRRGRSRKKPGPLANGH